MILQRVAEGIHGVIVSLSSIRTTSRVTDIYSLITRDMDVRLFIQFHLTIIVYDNSTYRNHNHINSIFTACQAPCCELMNNRSFVGIYQ
jgi:hypothetical protein